MWVEDIMLDIKIKGKFVIIHFCFDTRIPGDIQCNIFVTPSYIYDNFIGIVFMFV